MTAVFITSITFCDGGSEGSLQLFNQTDCSPSEPNLAAQGCLHLVTCQKVLLPCPTRALLSREAGVCAVSAVLQAENHHPSRGSR